MEKLDGPRRPTGPGITGSVAAPLSAAAAEPGRSPGGPTTQDRTEVGAGRYRLHSPARSRGRPGLAGPGYGRGPGRNLTCQCHVKGLREAPTRNMQKDKGHTGHNSSSKQGWQGERHWAAARPRATLRLGVRIRP